MKLHFNSTAIKEQFLTRISLVLTVALIAIVLFECFVIKRSADLFLEIRKFSNYQGVAGAVRVNFKDYNEIESTIREAENFSPSVNVERVPFGTISTKQN